MPLEPVPRRPRRDHHLAGRQHRGQLAERLGPAPASSPASNGAYLDEFLPFSGDQIFRAVNSTVTDVDFFLPGSSTPATTRGFARRLHRRRPAQHDQGRGLRRQGQADRRDLRAAGRQGRLDRLRRRRRGRADRQACASPAARWPSARRPSTASAPGRTSSRWTTSSSATPSRGRTSPWPSPTRPIPVASGANLIYTATVTNSGAGRVDRLDPELVAARGRRPGLGHAEPGHVRHGDLLRPRRHRRGAARPPSPSSPSRRRRAPCRRSSGRSSANDGTPANDAVDADDDGHRGRPRATPRRRRSSSPTRP